MAPANKQRADEREEERMDKAGDIDVHAAAAAAAVAAAEHEREHDVQTGSYDLAVTDEHVNEGMTSHGADLGVGTSGDNGDEQQEQDMSNGHSVPFALPPSEELLTLLGSEGNARFYDAVRLESLATAQQLLNRLSEVVNLLRSQGNDTVLQVQSHESLTAYLKEKKGSWGNMLSRAFATFAAFCEQRNIPVFPMSVPKCAMYLLRGESLIDDVTLFVPEGSAGVAAVKPYIGRTSSQSSRRTATGLAGKKQRLTRRTLEQYINRLTTLRLRSSDPWHQRMGRELEMVQGLTGSPLIRDILSRAEDSAHAGASTRGGKPPGATGRVTKKRKVSHTPEVSPGHFESSKDLVVGDQDGTVGLPASFAVVSGEGGTSFTVANAAVHHQQPLEPGPKLFTLAPQAFIAAYSYVSSMAEPEDAVDGGDASDGGGEVALSLGQVDLAAGPTASRELDGQDADVNVGEGYEGDDGDVTNGGSQEEMAALDEDELDDAETLDLERLARSAINQGLGGHQGDDEEEDEDSIAIDPSLS